MPQGKRLSQAKINAIAALYRDDPGTPTAEAARMLGLSHDCIRQRCRRLGIDMSLRRSKTRGSVDGESLSGGARFLSDEAMERKKLRRAFLRDLRAGDAGAKARVLDEAPGLRYWEHRGQVLYGVRL